MRQLYFVKFGIQQHIGLLQNLAAVSLTRDDRVVCETSRGIESGVILNSTDQGQFEGEHPHGAILRPFTHNDILLDERLTRYRQRAFDACQELLSLHQIQTPLIDAELLHDGENLFFYFLGELDEAHASVVSALANRYGQKIRFQQFAEKLATGCGPGCGTTASKCSTGSCSSCSLATKCGTSDKN
jgi:cell fate regulator YaaT (PSP1 superfamily)